ncbi:hypothetical protein GA0115243_1106203 [Streptomyces sp. ScaeMP-e83]|nr:hypothetical protein [Streptomyces sp. SID4937]SCE34080.1 hypothetical protein GA0115243_1106203 [Streptomyces sp. ScaeMP-e83]
MGGQIVAKIKKWSPRLRGCSRLGPAARAAPGMVPACGGVPALPQAQSPPAPAPALASGA